MAIFNPHITAAVSAANTKEPTVTITSYQKAGAGKARVMVDVNHTSESRADGSLVLAALAKKLGNKMVAVAGTFRNVDSSMFVQRVTGIMAVAHQIRPADNADQLKGFACVASNMFMDDEKEMWALRTTAGGKILVKTNGIEDDLSLVGLLDSCSSSTARLGNEFKSMSSYRSSKPEGGNFVTFVGADNTLRAGFVVAAHADAPSSIVLAFDSEEPEEVEDDAVVDTVDDNELPDYEDDEEDEADQSVSAARGVTSVEQIVAYYKKVYASKPEFFKQFVQRIRSHQFAR